MVTCSPHSLWRFNERMNIRSAEEALNNTQRAWRNGKTPNDYSGRAQRFLMNRERSHDDFTEIRIFKGFCFIFQSDGVLRTVYQLPEWVLNSNRPKRPRFRGEDDFFASDYEGIYVKLNRHGHFVSFFYANFVVKSICKFYEHTFEGGNAYE